MNKLIINFNASINNLKDLVALAPSKPTEFAIENGWPDDKDLELVRYMVEYIQETIKLLSPVGLISTPSKEQVNLIDSRLPFFRSLTKMLDSKPLNWSAYYDDIRKVMKEIHCLLIDIDTKYHLGSHKKDNFKD